MRARSPGFASHVGRQFPKSWARLDPEAKKSLLRTPVVRVNCLRDAEEALELAKVLTGEGALSDQDFLERMAQSDVLVDHDGETCGLCHNIVLGAQVAREMIEAGEYEDVVAKWAAESRRHWEQSKYFKLWQEEQRAGRDPHQAFNERGWEP